MLFSLIQNVFDKRKRLGRHRTKTEIRILFTLVFLFLFSCQKWSDGFWPIDKRQPLAFDVLYSGCDSVLSGPVCMLVPRDGISQTLQFWIKAPLHTNVTISAGPYQIDQLLLHEGGFFYQIRVSNFPTQLVFRLQLDNQRANWAMPIKALQVPSWIKAAESFYQKRQNQQCKELLKQHEPPADSFWLAWKYGKLARLASAEERYDDTLNYYEKAIALHQKSGCLSCNCKDSNAMAFTAIVYNRDFSRARKVLNQAQPPPGHADSEFHIAYEMSHLAREQGDLRNSFWHLKRAVDIAKRIRSEKLELAQEQSARVLLRLGRRQEAIAILDRLISDHHSNSPCGLASILANRGWASVLALHAGEDCGKAAVDTLSRALDLYQKNECPRGQTQVTSTLIDLASAFLQMGKTKEAQQQLSTIRTSPKPLIPMWELWIAQLQGLLALQRRDYKTAYSLFQNLLKRSDRIIANDVSWQAMLGCARALSGLGRSLDALHFYQRAESYSRHSALQVALGDGRAAFLAQHFRAVQEHIALLLSLGRTKQAMQVARRARALHLFTANQTIRLQHLSKHQRKNWEQAISRYRQALDQINTSASQDWQLSEREWALIADRRRHQRTQAQHFLDQALSILPEEKIHTFDDAREGELILLYFPLGKTWQGFAQDSRSLVSKPVPNACDNRWENNGKQLLSAFQKQIVRNQRVRILTFGCLANKDFHALPFMDNILLASKEVVYGLDVGGHTADISVDKRGRAVFVIDPEQNLPRAKRDLKTFSQLEKQGFQIGLRIGQAATAASVLGEISNSRLFHFSGHSEVDSLFGWDNRLRLADSTSLKPGDIFAAEKVPQSVVLLSCESAGSTTKPMNSMGLAQAFIANGSLEVLATTRPITDTLGEEITSTLYAPFTNLVDSARRAILAARKHKPQLDWAALRIIVP